MLWAGSAWLGVGLVIVWLQGTTVGATIWLTWLNALLAAASFVLVGISLSRNRGDKQAIGPAILSAALYAMWIVGLALGASGFLVWWDFAFASLYLTLSVAEAGAQRYLVRRPGPTDN